MNNWKGTVSRFIEKSYEVEAVFNVIFYVGAVIAVLAFAIYLALH